jgi:hypothetical protein
MPFTPAHCAIVLPFLKIDRRYVSATGLVIGSFAPDFEYFLKFNVESQYSHTLPGIFFFDLPVCLVLAVVFHSVVKHNLIGNLPLVLQRRFQNLLHLDFLKVLKSNPLPFVVSVLIGTLSHIFWDGFTHHNGYFVNELPFYKGTFVPYDGVRYPLWYALQHISTFAGLTIVTLYTFFTKEQQGDLHRPSVIYWLALIAITAMVVIIRFAIRSDDYNLGNFVVSCISGFCIALISCGFMSFERSNL